MKSKNFYTDAEDDTEATLVEPRFDEEAKEAARPVVPLSQVTSADLYAGAPARRGRSSWPHAMIITLAVIAVAAVVTAAALYRSNRTTATPTAPQTLSEASDVAPQPAAEQPAVRQAREDVTSAPPETPKEPEPRSIAAAREEPEKKWHKNEERNARDEEKAMERARKEEKKEARREEKEAERTALKPSDEGKREETRPRLVGIYVEGRKH